MAPLATLLCLAPLLIAALQGVPGVPAEPPAEPTALALDEAIALALSANRSLAAARLGREVARAGVEVARERPNPDLAFERTRETPKEALTLSQPIESAGKRRRRIALAEAQVGSGEADLARTALDVRNQVRRAFFGLAAAERRAAEGEAVVSLAGRVLETARQRFAAGGAPRLEALQAELAAAQADNQARNARGLLLGARGDLNTLLGR
ncbi:MAG TPA: TolC family protein, partial [Thermoanaerobaculia bacterium]|nr:TolC family protein [Thermoanaerobaculia bacterium]